MTRLPSSISRRVIGSSTLTDPTPELRQVTTAGQQPLLQRAVVVEVFGNPGSLTDEQKQAIANQVTNPEFVDVLPTNSILARFVNDSSDVGNPSSALLFPFFSSYLQLPVVPGEHVFVVYDDPSRRGTTIGYWLARTSEQRTVEDVNYNVSDRRFDPRYNPQLRATSERARQEESQDPPGFPNGGDSQGTYTLRITGSNDENPYFGILDGSTAVQQFSFEPVPRYNKRPGELVLQGKNNATIIFGEDRTGPYERVEQDSVGQAGSIDIVVGRGRVLPRTDTEEPEATSPRVITNSRDQKEVNKAPYLSQENNDNPNEGDPDFNLDAARLLVSMQTEADINFQITEQPFPDNVLEFSQPKEGSEGTEGKSYVLGKADNIRLIARKTDEIKGTILILREGDSEENIGYLHINEDGKVQLLGPEIYLGKSTGQEEPYIKWSEYKNSIQNLQDQVDALKNFCEQLTTTLQTAFSTAIAVPYNQIASLNAVANILPNAIYRPLDTTIVQKKQALLQSGNNSIVDKAKSKVIFGE